MSSVTGLRDSNYRSDFGRAWFRSSEATEMRDRVPGELPRSLHLRALQGSDAEPDQSARPNAEAI